MTALSSVINVQAQFCHFLATRGILIGCWPWQQDHMGLNISSSSLCTYSVVRNQIKVGCENYLHHIQPTLLWRFGKNRCCIVKVVWKLLLNYTVDSVIWVCMALKHSRSHSFQRYSSLIIMKCKKYWYVLLFDLISMSYN